MRSVVPQPASAVSRAAGVAAFFSLETKRERDMTINPG